MAKAKKTAEKKAESKPTEYVVTKDRLLLGPRVFVRDEKLTEGKEVEADKAKQYAKNGWIARA